ncbi:MAG: arsenate reductase ArsC [Verrucomicrobia bacterium]|nr:arsenate reductase ArsC [Verrucomicrobiota bacterium]
MEKLKILFLCTGNSCRSQMAEGWAHALKSDVLEPYSAGIETHGLNPNAVKVMAEVGVDITGQKSENINDLLDIPFDVVITVCGHAHDNCPIFPGKATRVVHVGFDDPPKLSPPDAPEEMKLDGFRRVRDEIKAFIEQLPGNLEENAS